MEWHGGTLKQPERRVIGLQQRKIGTEAHVLVNRYSLSQYPKFDGPEGPPGSAQQLQEKFQLKALHLRNNPLLQHPELSRKMNLCHGSKWFPERAIGLTTGIPIGEFSATIPMNQPN